jgi:hypothetical protein
MLFCHLLLFAVWKYGNRAVTDKVAVLQDVHSAFLQNSWPPSVWEIIVEVSGSANDRF